MNIETIERQIFGAHLGRLNWAPASSPLSRHYMNEHGECVGLDPIRDPATKLLVDQAVHARPGDQRIFTIVDTGAMEVTLFQAKRPPVAFLVAGEEGGMQRAIGVSYQWETATCYRETVLRMQTPWVEMMDRCPRVRFGLKREMMPVKPVSTVQSV